MTDNCVHIKDIARGILYDIAEKNGCKVERYSIEPDYKKGRTEKRELTEKEVNSREDSRVQKEQKINELKDTRDRLYKASDAYNPYQEAHSATVDVAGVNSLKVCRRRVQDARVQDKIDEVGGNVAAIRIARAYHHMVNGMGAKISSIYTKEYVRAGFENQLSDEDWIGYLNKCVKYYQKWRNLAFEVNCDAVLDIVYWGESFDAVTRKYKKRNGWAAENLVNGLEIYNKMEEK